MAQRTRPQSLFDCFIDTRCLWHPSLDQTSLPFELASTDRFYLRFNRNSGLPSSSRNISLLLPNIDVSLLQFVTFRLFISRRFSRGTTEATVAYASIALILLFSRHQWNAGLTICWILLTSLLKRPHNLLLTVLQLWQYSLMQSALNSRRLRPFYRGLAHYWLGMAWYFHQGNGNNLARIDLSAGYVGLSHYNPVTVGFLLSCATYSGPVLSYLFSLQYYSVGMRSAFLWCRSLVISLFFVFVTCLRYHLFVWTVFSPKLLYEGIFTCFLLLAMFCTVPTTKSKD